MKSVVLNEKVRGAFVPRSSNVELPFVAVTFARTVDGKVTTKNYDSVDFTSREDKAHLIRQRALGDAVLVGHGTIENETCGWGFRGKTYARSESHADNRPIRSG